jgi:6-phosphogluconolactonase
MNQPPDPSGRAAGRPITWLASPEALAQAVAAALTEHLEAQLASRPMFTLALSGGRIAGPLYDALVAAERARPRPLLAAPGVHFFFADERCVPPDHPESNFALARARLFAPLDLPPERVHRLRGEADPAVAAAEAERELRSLTATPARDLPRLDLVWLGLGEDGHVASLFPGAPATVTESRAVYLPVTGPKPPPQRLTLTYAALAAARAVWVLVSGPGKAAALAESLRPDGATPLARVLREQPAARIFTDLPELPAAGRVG